MSTKYQASESVTVAGTATTLTLATALDYKEALITVETAAVRFWLDGSTPTASVGHVLEPGDELLLDSNDQIRSASFIRRDGTSATLSASYGR